jgi:inositol transport system substrate-binding protein
MLHHNIRERHPMKRLIAAGITTLILTTPAMAANTRIGVTMALFDDNFLTNVREAMAAKANSTGNVSISFEDAQADIGRQINQVQNFIAEGVDAIIVNPADTAATVSITKMVSQAGIPLVYVNRGPEQKKLPDNVVVVESDHIVAGRMQMEALAECMGGKGNVAIMLGELASNATQQRTAGNKEVIKKFPDIKVVEEQTANYQRSQAINLMTNWIASGTKIDAVAANNDEMAIGALIAMKQAGIAPDKVCVGGVDATREALNRMKEGDLDVSVFQDAKGQGAAAVEAAVKLAGDEKVDQYLMIPYELVTPDQVATYESR